VPLTEIELPSMETSITGSPADLVPVPPKATAVVSTAATRAAARNVTSFKIGSPLFYGLQNWMLARDIDNSMQ
jgi:hypothetical protein